MFDEAPSFHPASGGVEGGMAFTITGHGFTITSDDQSVVTTVEIGSQPCDVLSSTHSVLICETPALSAGTYDVVVTVGGVGHSFVGSFSSASPVTPVVDVMSPVSGGVGDEIVITGSGFAGTPAMNTVKLRAEDNSLTPCVATAR